MGLGENSPFLLSPLGDFEVDKEFVEEREGDAAT